MLLSVLCVGAVLTGCSVAPQLGVPSTGLRCLRSASADGGVTFLGEDRSVEDGPGFTSAKYNVVSRHDSSSLSCQAVERSWADVLTRAHREFRIYHYPHKFGAIGSLEIDITDTPDNLVIFIGFDTGECNKPLLSASDSPH